MARTLRDPFVLHTTLGNQAFILAERGDLERALQLAGDKKKICWELGDRRGLADALEKVALIHAKRGEFETGLAHAEEAAAICKELGDSRGLVQQLLAQSVCWEGLRRPEDELRCVEEAFHLALAVGLPDVIRQIEPTREKVRSKILSEQSISNYRLAVLVNPDDPEAHNDLAIALFQGGDIDGAILELNEVIRLMPTSAMGYFGLGTIYDKAGDQHAALEQFRIAHQIDPSPMTLEAVRTLERAMGTGPRA
jgi:tetratricopeptide (TPR) repeat protein